MSTANPEPYSERIRLAEIIADARKLLGAPVISYPSRIGQLEAMLTMLADSAAGALRLNEPAPQEARAIPWGEGVGGSTSATHTMPGWYEPGDAIR